MQIARRGGHKSSRVKPGDANGYLQAIRDSIMNDEMSKRQIPPVEEAEEGEKIWRPKLRTAGTSTPIFSDRRR